VQAGFAAVRSPEFPDPDQEVPAFRSKRRQTQSWTPQAFMATLIAIVLFGSIAWTQAANYYINASGPLGDGSGSSASNAADASSASKYGAIVNAQSSSGTTIVYAAGTYQVNPTLPMYNGVAHQGAGIDKTIIKVIDAASPCSNMWGTNNGTISGFKFFDATLDLNAGKQTWFTSGAHGGSQAFTISTADHCTFQRLKFINMAASGVETFIINFGNNAGPGNMNNNLIDSCIFTQPIFAGNSNGGMTCILLYDIGPSTTVDSTNVVSNCQFIKLSRPYSDFQYVNAATAPNVINNFAQGVDELWYIEPGSQSSGNQINYPGITAQVTGNTLVNSGYVARILMHSNGTYAGNLNVQNNTVGMMQNPLAFFGPRGPGGVEIETFDSGNSSVGNVTVQNNTFTAPLPPWTANPAAVIANPSSPDLFHLPSLTVINNQMIGFPGDGSELEVNKAQIGTYTNTGNTFGSAVRRDRPPHHHKTLAHRLH
jgi:hypothetical protein